MMNIVNQIEESADFLRSMIDHDYEIGIVLGSGLGDLADKIAQDTAVPYSVIPNFCESTVAGHKGNLIFGTLGGHNVVAMQGRFHYYEGYSMKEVTFPIRVMRHLGVKTLFVSNAAGAVNPSFKVGDLMIITDHINLMPNPLIGPNMEGYGPRFPDMTTTYSRRITLMAHAYAEKMGIELREGVYLGNSGPSYETLAEYKFYATAGADAVGMSTVPEVIVARHCGMEIFGMSIITNQANDLRDGVFNDGNDVIEEAQKATEKLSALFENVISML